ncbi:MAG TPA: GH92 family glycosyl hydrolase, partial [Candidatus Sulfotelmatobacter sp.]|nr:GH92 family glycosyl hydrolase [Candidatus Sulfotelmatobacter sp.]
HGHAYPGAIVPFGMMQLSPDTPIQGWDGCSGYHYTDSAIRGFSHTHLAGTGCGCLGDILVMPTVGEVQLEAGSPGKGYTSRFSHADELAVPGYYRVLLQDPQVLAELTATIRCGLHKYTFPATDNAHIVLDLVHGIGNDAVEATINVENNTTISGSRISNGWGGRRAIYFVMQFSKPFASFGIEQDKQRLGADARAGKGRQMKAFVSYKTSAKEAVLVKVGISGTGIEGARKNLAAEIPDWNFEKIHAAATKQWKQLLDTVQVETFDPHIRNTFYANLYLCCQAPVIYNDVDGTYRGMDRQNHAGAGFQNYTIFSLWDTYRAEHPLLNLLQPQRVDDMVQSMVAEYKESGHHSTPIWPLWGNETWCMIGYHSVAVIAEAYLKGFRGFDAEAAYQALRDTAMGDRNGLKSYRERGYVDSRRGAEATSRTIEYTYDDWCLARMAEALGHKEDAELFYKRSANYRNHFDRSVNFFRGRKADGSWRKPFNPIGMVGDEYTEADAWQYAFAIQQDVPGLMGLYGGDEGFVQRLDAMFAADSTIQTSIPDITGRIGQFAHGDEQCHHVSYLYNYAGVPYKTQQRVRQVMDTFYKDTPDGQCGNIDCGQMAAWYVFSALGFYPVNPASGVYMIGSPVVTKAVLNLDAKKYKGCKFTVIAKNNSPKNVYIQSASLNGKPLNQAWLTHEQITAGGTLTLVMGPQPNLEWGKAQSVRPPTTMPANFRYPELPAPSVDKREVLTLPIKVICGSDEPAQGFVPDPNMVDGATNGKRGKIDTSAPNAAPEAVYLSERYSQDFAYVFEVPKDGRYQVRLHFAEIFNSEVGSRVENISLNGQVVLKDFDILKTAGAMNKAVVKEFNDVAPDSQGNIVVRIAAAPQSPDKNAKICGIEILKAGQ